MTRHYGEHFPQFCPHPAEDRCCCLSHTWPLCKPMATWANTTIAKHLLFDAAPKPLPDQSAEELVAEAVAVDGAHHKQWYLEQIAARLDVALPEHEAGIAP